LKKNKILKESLWSFFGQLISAVAIIAGVRVITEYVTPIHYGQHIVFSGIILLFFNVISGSIFQAFLRIIPENDNDISYNKSLLLSSKISMLYTLIGLVFLLLSFLLNSHFLFLIFTFFLSLLSEHVVGLFKVLMNVNREQKKYAFFQILISTIIIIFAVLLYVYYENSFKSIVYGFSIANLLISFLFFGKIISVNLIKSSKTKFYWHNFSEFFDFSKPLVLQKIFGWSLSNADKYIIAFFLGTATAGKYAPIVSLVSMLFLTVSGAIEIFFILYYFEYIANNKKQNSKKILRIYAIMLAVASIIFVSIFSIFNQQIVLLVLGKNFREFFYLLPFLSLGFSFLIFGYLFENICFAYKKTWNVFLIEGISALTNIIVLPIMIYNFGIIGIPFALSCTYIVHFLSGYIITRKLLKNV